jgi:tetraacyldisaccharide 4'-kinase
LNQETYRKLISGESRGAVGVVLLFFLQIAAAGYTAIIAVRNFLYSKSWLETRRVSATIFSIGNITVGGTGKTPLVIWLCKFLQQKGIQCAILTRGYRTRRHNRASSIEYRASRIDEPAILAESCPQAKVIVNPDRVAGATEAINKFGAKVLIMDDGFQHRRLRRNLDIVTIDATCPFGYGKILPAGLLREPVTSLKRADAVVITRSDQVQQAELHKIEENLQQINPNMIVTRSMHEPVCAKSIDGKEISIEQLSGKKVFAFCGIGNPQSFLDTIKSVNVQMVGSKIYNDHHHYIDADISNIREQARVCGANLILTTQKDWTKIRHLIPTKEDIPLVYLAVDLKFLSGEDRLKGLIGDELSGKILKK